MKGSINKGIANPHTQPQRIANPLERDMGGNNYESFVLF